MEVGLRLVEAVHLGDLRRASNRNRAAAYGAADADLQSSETIARLYREAPLSMMETFVRDLLAEAWYLRAERDESRFDFDRVRSQVCPGVERAGAETVIEAHLALRVERDALAAKASAFLEALADWDDVRDWTPDAAEYAPAEDAYDAARDALRDALGRQ